MKTERRPGPGAAATLWCRQARVVRAWLIAALLIPAATSALEIGDPPPAVALLGESSAGAHSPEVVIFGAAWCPLTRHLLARLDSLWAPRSAGDRPRVRAVLAGTPESVDVLARQGGWTSVELLADVGGSARRAYLGAIGVTRIPYAFVIERAEGGARIAWHGVAVRSEDDDPLARFQSVVTRVAAGGFELAKERERRAALARATRIVASLRDASPSDVTAEPETWRRMLDTLRTTEPEILRDTDPTAALNAFAWELVAPEAPAAGALEMAERAMALALATGGAEDPAVLDTQARLIYQQGDLERALAVQREAVALAVGGPYEGQLRPALEAYAEEAGVVLEAPAAPDGTTGPHAWHGVLNDVWLGPFGERLTLVRPSETGDPEQDAVWTERLRALAERLSPGGGQLPADAVTQALCGERVLVLYGSPETNPRLADVLAARGVALDADGVTIGGMRIEIAAPVLIAAFASPWAQQLPVVVYAAHDASDALQANRFFHGPTSVVIGRWTNEGDPEVVHTFDVEVENGSGDLRALVGPPSLTREEAIADLRELHELLASHYAGYDDIEWALGARGTSWADRTVEQERVLSGQPSVSWTSFFDSLTDYLSVVNDTHFTMSGRAHGERMLLSRDARLVHALAPFVADVRAIAVEGGYALAGDPAVRVDLAPLPSPYDIAPLRPYALPTWPEGEYLVGVFAKETPLPEPIPLGPIAGEAGETYTLEVHRLRCHRDRAGGDTWSLIEPLDVPFPVLGVRTMNTRQLEGMPETAAELAKAPVFALDLRGNGGGADLPGMRWCVTLSRQTFVGMGGAALHEGEEDPFRRWDAFLPSPIGLTPVEPSRERYAGRVYVLMDRDVYSSGETFVGFASQLDGAVLVGESTAGCARYGNVRSRGPLTHSRIDLHFGVTRFVMDEMRENAEGVGMFPDIWLDEADPITSLAARGAD